ncbi:hypothetical protein BC936DRAFT_148747 [Jimgerdemannia flammicorona]|uniref:Uncharacterized protein n=2 Tax=Jimgerdemannia flammicorona TaxID=994334 RepID=A0A433D2E0_9FUNG|nr:hypothetical protein BC936DRAFT_148747 [Jimgerdemannia flammicorona]RUS34585.1 hypothetical protein BC938DRAFT_479597 [Jimgerdemannia flammicorona]
MNCDEVQSIDQYMQHSNRLITKVPRHMKNIYIMIAPAFVRFIILGVFQQNFVHICARVLDEFVVGVEDDERDLAVAKNAEFIRLLHQTEFSLQEGNL